jgi:uncharacterized membrane protein
VADDQDGSDVVRHDVGPSYDDEAPLQVGEHRWQMMLAALAALVIHQLLPETFRLAPQWLYPALMAGFLVLLLAGDPGVIDRERRWLRVVTGLLIAMIALSNLFSAMRLIDGILNGDSNLQSANVLLGIGAGIWTTNVIAFALWYWDTDGGGSASRARRGAWARPAFVFPEMNLPEAVGRDWYPQFVDYLALSFNTATAFSPTDVSAIRRWAKLLMILESTVSLALATLVVAKAINSIGS